MILAEAWWMISFLGNSIFQWLALLGVILASLILGKLVSHILTWQCRRLEAAERFNILGLMLNAAARPSVLLTFAAGLYIVPSFLDLRGTSDTVDIVHYWMQICDALAVIAASWFIFRLVDVVEFFLNRWTSKTETALDDQIVPLIRKSLRIFVVIVAALFIAQNILGWNVAALLAGLGIGGLAFAFASKDMIANFFGSIMVFADRPFTIGERIVCRGYDGTIEEVGFRSTRIRTLTGHLVTIPNGVLANEPIENIGRRPTIRRLLNVTVTYDTTPEKLQRGVEILREMLDARMEHFPEDFPPKVYFSDFNADSLNIFVIYWFTPPAYWDFLEFNHDFNMELLRRYNEEGIEFAFPTQTLYLKQDSDLKANLAIDQLPEQLRP